MFNVQVTCDRPNTKYHFPRRFDGVCISRLMIIALLYGLECSFSRRKRTVYQHKSHDKVKAIHNSHLVCLHSNEIKTHFFPRFQS